jgi:hypothetical protein
VSAVLTAAMAADIVNALVFRQQISDEFRWYENWSEEIKALESIARSETICVQGWRPIAEAPKTGRTLLLGYRNRAGKWRTVRGQWMPASEIEQWEDFEGDPIDSEGWYETSDNADDPPTCWHIAPSHFMFTPLEPPHDP